MQPRRHTNAFRRKNIPSHTAMFVADNLPRYCSAPIHYAPDNSNSNSNRSKHTHTHIHTQHTTNRHSSTAISDPQTYLGPDPATRRADTQQPLGSTHTALTKTHRVAG
eukprot:Opistho-2@57998